MASVTDKANGIVGKPAGKEADNPKPAAEHDVVDVDGEEGGAGEEDEEEEEQDEDADDEEERQMVGDDEDEDDLAEDGEEQEGQDNLDKPQNLTELLLADPGLGQPDDDDFDGEETEDVYIPPAPEPISRKRSHQEVAEDDEEPGSKKAKA